MKNINVQYKSIDERVENFKLFYERKNTRPLLGFFIESEYPLKRYYSSKQLPEGRYLSPDDFKVEAFLDDCDRLYYTHEACGGDFIFSGSIFWGIPWVEVALGCPIIASHATGSIHTESPKGFQGASSIPKFSEDLPWVNKAGEYLKKLAKRSNGKWPIGTTRMRGISDLLAALYGGENFIYSMMEEPEEMLQLCEKLTDFYIAFAQYQLDHIPLFHGGVGSFYYHMWAPKGTVWHQEDSSALLSPALYDEFIKPFDEKIVKTFAGNIIHQHPTGYLPTDKYIEMGMTALELHVDEGGPSAESLYQLHIKILEKKPLLIWGKLNKQDLDWIFSKLPAKGLAIMTVVDNHEQAVELWNKYIKA